MAQKGIRHSMGRIINSNNDHIGCKSRMWSMLGGSNVKVELVRERLELSRCSDVSPALGPE